MKLGGMRLDEFFWHIRGRFAFTSVTSVDMTEIGEHQEALFPM